MKNQALDTARTFTATVDGYALTMTETIRQEYRDCVFSAGSVEGHPVDTQYLLFEDADGASREIFVLLRPDESAALAGCLIGNGWSDYSNAWSAE